MGFQRPGSRTSSRKLFNIQSPAVGVEQPGEVPDLVPTAKFKGESVKGPGLEDIDPSNKVPALPPRAGKRLARAVEDPRALGIFAAGATLHCHRVWQVSSTQPRSSW